MLITVDAVQEVQAGLVDQTVRQKRIALREDRLADQRSALRDDEQTNAVLAALQRDLPNSAYDPLGIVVKPCPKRFRNDSVRMKPWLSHETMQCEEKQVPRYDAKTPRLIIGLSNHQTPTKIANDDRRWFVVNSPAEPQDTTYYDGLWKHLDSDYEMGGVLRYLLERDLSQFSPKARPPMTHAKANLAEDSRTPLAQAIQNLIADETTPFNRDLVSLEAVGAALAGKQLGSPVTPSKLKAALQEIGAEYLGQKDIGPHGRKRLYAWRNLKVWREATPLQMRQHLDVGSVPAHAGCKGAELDQP